MKIDIDFNQNEIASEYYSDNKQVLDKSILDLLSMGDNPKVSGSMLRLPTGHLMNNNYIKALCFKLEIGLEDFIIMHLVSIEQ